MVAGGNKQCSYIPKEKDTAPTASLESVMLTSVIDAQEGYDITIANMPNAFIQTHLTQDDDKVVMWLYGSLATLLADLTLDVYGTYLTKDKHGQPILYV